MQNFCIAFTLPDKSKALTMREPQPCTLRACKSGIISAANFIIQKFPIMRPPFQYEGQWPQPKVTAQQPWEEGIYHPFFEIWNQILVEAVIGNQAIYAKDTFYVEVKLQNGALEKEEKIPTEFQWTTYETASDSKNLLCQLFKLSQALKASEKKMAIIGTHPIYNVQGYPFAPVINMESLFLGSLFNNQSWTFIEPTRGQIPSVQELASFTGVVLPGSRLSVVDMYPELTKTLQNLDKALQINKNLRVLAVCYGHQAVAQFYKAKVQKLPRKGGIQSVEFSQTMKNKYKFLVDDLWKESPLIISEHHQDFVMEVPKGFQLLAKSKSCLVESLVRKDGRIFTTQFHSEFFIAFTKVVKQRSTYYWKQPMYQTLYEPQTEQVQAKSMRHSQLMYKCFKLFLRQDL